MGEENKKEEEKKEETKDEKKEEKNEEKKEENKEEETAETEAEEPTEIIFKVDMHCEACARKVARALRGFQGVENVTTDSKAGKVVVKGKAAAADPLKVYERLQKKSGRKVELISPLPKPPQQQQQQQQQNQQIKEENKEPKQQKKEEPPAVVTVVLKVHMHCEACAQVLRKRIRKIKGVESVETEFASNEVVVKGVIDPTTLVDHVYKRTRKQASIVKNEEKKEEKKEEEKPAAEEKGEEKKESQEEKEEDEEKKSEIKKMEYWPSKYYTEYAYAPQLFSDENPNACSIL